MNNLREIQALRRLSPHPGIMKLCEVLYDQPTRRLALVFELMDMNIYELIRGRRQYLQIKERTDEVKIAVVLNPGEDFDPEELIEFLKTRMPRFAIPRFVEIWDELPKTEATARIQKAKIREKNYIFHCKSESLLSMQRLIFTVKNVVFFTNFAFS